MTEYHRRNNYHNTLTIYYHAQCKDCMIKRVRVWKELNRERFLKYQREYQSKKYHERKNKGV